jgi:hypothetical protein
VRGKPLVKNSLVKDILSFPLFVILTAFLALVWLPCAVFDLLKGR